VEESLTGKCVPIRLRCTGADDRNPREAHFDFRSLLAVVASRRPKTPRYRSEVRAKSAKSSSALQCNSRPNPYFRTGQDRARGAESKEQLKRLNGPPLVRNHRDGLLVVNLSNSKFGF